jgi:nickel-dependent lactate racemase
MAEASHGLMTEPINVSLNKLILDYDHLLICGPVFPHEVAGFSGGAKNLFPGIAGAEIINKTHWLGALATSMDTIGVADTAVRRVLDEAAHLVQAIKPITLLALVLKGEGLHGLFSGDIFEAWVEAVKLSAQLNIRYSSQPFHTILSMPSTKYEDLWTAAKAMYKTEPVAAAGGEVIIYAPHLKEISYSHGDHIREVGYHVRDYFVKQWDTFSHMPGGVLAHSTHVKGQGTFEAGLEQPRIQVTLATGIPEADCRQINLGYRDPATIDPAAYAGREAEGILLVENAGEYLYRLRAE